MKKSIKLECNVDNKHPFPEIFGNLLVGIFRNGYLWILALSSILVFVAGLAAANRPLWFDELFTYYVSSLGDSYSVVDALLHKADYYPPLDHLIRHFSLNAFGQSNLAFRAPSIIFFFYCFIMPLSFCKNAYVCDSGTTCILLSSTCFDVALFA